MLSSMLTIPAREESSLTDNADRIEISNPGTLLISHEQLLRGGISECRNKSLQLMFQTMGAGDKAGSGLDKIRASWAAARFRAPELRETRRPDRVELSLPMMSILPDSALEQLEALFRSRLGILSPDEIQILVMALEEGSITNLRLQEVLTIHRTDLTKILQNLVKSEFLLRSGFGRWTKYVLPDPQINVTFAADDPNTANTAQPIIIDQPPRAGGLPPINSEGTSDGSCEGTSERTSREMQSAQSPEYGTDHSLAPEVWDRLMKIGASARARTWLAKEEQTDLVLQLCREAGWLTKAQLAQLLGRSGENLRDRLLNDMVRDGRLKLRYPSRNHPGQAYARGGKAAPNNEG